MRRADRFPARVRAAAALLFCALGACAGRAPSRPPFYEDAYARYYAVGKDRTLRVETDGTVLDVTCLGVDAAAGRPRADLPRRSCPRGEIPVVGKARRRGGDWDMSAYARADASPVPGEESGGCRPLFGSVGLDSRENPPPESCWNRFWEVPAAVVLAPVAVGVVLGAATAPIWVPLVFLR